MEFLYNLSLTAATSEQRSRILGLSWSRDNFLCVSSLYVKEDVLHNDLNSNKVNCQVNIIDPNRPWVLHSVLADSSEMVHKMEWSVDGKYLMLITECGKLSLWTRRDNCLNTWEKVYGVEVDGSVVTAEWISTSLQVNINYGKNSWEELFTKCQCTHSLQKVTDSGIAILTSDGKLHIFTLQANSSAPEVVELVDMNSPNCEVSSADLTTKNDGTLLCAVGYNSGAVTVFSVKAKIRRFGQLQFDYDIVTKIDHSENVVVRQLKLVPNQLVGFNLHLLHGGTTLELWCLGDLCPPVNKELKRLAIYPSNSPLAMFSLTSLCFGSCDAMSSRDDDVIVLDDDDVRGHKESQRLVELLVVVTKYNTINCLRRDSYAVICENIPIEDRLNPPAMKQMRLANGDTVDQVLCLSPNGCCVAIGVRGNIYFFDCGRLLTNKGSTSNLFVLFLLAIVCNRLPWDVAVTCAISSSTDSSHVLNVLYQLSRSYAKQESHVQCRYLTQYNTAKSILYSCLDDGVQSALELSSVVRLYAVYNLLSLYMIYDNNSGHCSELLKSTCESNKTETKLLNVYQLLPVKELLPASVVQRLQPHLHWTLEYAVRIVSRLAKKELQKVPDPSCLSVLRELLVVLHSVNNVTVLPQLHNISDLVGLLFKAITLYCQSSIAFVSFPDSLLTELSELPSETNNNQLTLSKAAFLQGFLCGLSAGPCLPHAYYIGSPPPIRQHVLNKQVVNDPYSPLALVVPKNLSPPWQDRLCEGHGDSLHYGTIINNKQTARQCSRCRHWASFTDVSEQSVLSMSSNDIIMDITSTWDNMWDQCCPCGGLWCQYCSD